MFFKNIAEWSKRKVFWMNILFSVLYFVFMVVVPIILIVCNYTVETVEKDKVLTGWGLAFLLLVTVVGLFTIKKLSRKIPEETYKQQVIRYTLELVQSLILPVTAFLVIHQLKVNFDLAYMVISWCIVSFIVGILIDGLCLKYLDHELKYNREIEHTQELEKRSHRIQR